MNIAFLSLLPACLRACPPACMSVCLNRLPGLMPAFGGIHWKYPVRLQVDSWQGWRCSAFKNTHSVRQQMWDNYFSAAALKLVPKNVMSRPSDTHRGWILCQLECIELKKCVCVYGGGGAVVKTENKLSPSTDYYWGRCLGVWNCVLRSMCGLVPLFFKSGSVGFTGTTSSRCQLNINIRRSH